MFKVNIKFLALIAGLVSILSLAACSDDDPPLPDNLVAFGTATVGLADEDEIEINLTLTRSVSTATTVQISYTATGVVYGDDFTIDPTPTENTFSVIIPANATTASFTVVRTAPTLEGTESIAFEIINAGETGVIIGETKAITLSFSYIISEGSQLTLQGKTETSNYTNAVYADLSANAQTAIDRKSWNLAFYGGAEFKVVLNAYTQTTAAALTKTDISTVTLEDAETIANLDHANPFPSGNHANLALVDYYDGALNKLVFADVSATESENKVYLVSFEGNKAKASWYKVKVNRNGAGYRVHYALIGETTIKTLDVAKNADFNFSFASLVTNQTVSVEPRKTNWDIAWGYNTYTSVTTNPSSEPYWYQDFVSLNYLGGAQATEIIKTTATEAETAYASFAEADLTGLVFLQTRDAIGSKWRTTTGAGIRRERFYVVKDTEGNFYKLRFLTMGVGDAGERGRPVIEYALVKKAS